MFKYCKCKENLKKIKIITLNKTKYTLFYLLMLVSCTITGQDLVFSQFYNSPLNLNPALAGTNTFAQFNANYRLQWPGLSKVYESFTLGYNQYFRDINSGFGVNIVSDNSGDGALQFLNVAGNYMYRLTLAGDLQLRIGLEVGFGQNRLNYNQLIFGDQIDISGPINAGGGIIASNEIPPNSLNKGYLDLGTGFMVYNKNWFVGLTMKHLNTPDNGFLLTNTVGKIGLPLLFNLHGSYQYVFDIGNKQTNPSFLSPSILLARQGDFWQFNVGSYVQLRNFVGGVYYRHAQTNPDALIISAGVNLNTIKITYSFDITLSELALSSGGAHEIGIIYNLITKEQQYSKLDDCLQLFR